MFADVYIDPLPALFTYRVPEGVILKTGMRVTVPFGSGNRKVTAYTAAVHDKEPIGFDVKEISAIKDDEPVYDERLLNLCKFTAYSYCSNVSEAMAMALPSAGKPAVYKPQAEAAPPQQPSLTAEQREVVNRIGEQFAAGERLHCLFGITGSGKTEVYIYLAQQSVAQGKSVIYLVPEISLSSQIYRRLAAMFGESLVMYHSRLSAGQKMLAWKRFYSGEAKIAVGTRSAVFMQAPTLGLIVMDEEQDSSFKEHSSPRYNAKRLAVYRGKSEDALVVLGSATPAMETLYAAEQGQIKLHRLKERFGGAALPSIEIVPFVPTEREVISNTLKIETKHALEGGGQAIYLLNRRGFAPVVICDDCSEPVKCPHCTISLNYHRGGNLICHYCGYQTPMPDVCNACGSRRLAKVGAGTQKLEEAISAYFVKFNVRRMDFDSTRRKGSIEEIIASMTDKSTDILIGTQMVAKGFNFPDVAVVGILNADLGLSLPDFRAGERIFSLLVQAAGRAGRGKREGKVFLQTMDPKHPVFGFIKTQDYESFYKEELEQRRALRYPPFSRLVRLLFRGADEAKVMAAVKEAEPVLRSFARRFPSDVSVLGPAAAPIEKIGDNFRHHFILKGKLVEQVRETARLLRDTVKLPHGVYLEIDIDPVDLM